MLIGVYVYRYFENMKKIIIISVLSFSFALSNKAQQTNILEKPGANKCNQLQTEDTTTLLHAFKGGQFEGHFRSFFMSTQNEKGLAAYYANALGTELRFETNKFHNVQFAIGGMSVFNVGSSNLTKPDALTGQISRYEIGLFDITNPAKKDLYRLEELYLKYTIRQSSVKTGRQFINTPFINLQDGRMNSTAVAGIWGEMNEIKKVKIQFGWLWGMSPRSTGLWYNPGQSIGVYPSGMNPDGTKSQYSKNIKSEGIVIIGITKMISDNVKIQVWDMFTKNVLIQP